MNRRFLDLFGLILVLSFGVSRGEEEVGDLQSAIHKLKTQLFTVKCDDANEGHLYSDWITCLWPHGDLRAMVRDFVQDAREKDCKMPPRKLVAIALQTLRGSNYVDHPLYKKIPQTQCGYCGRKSRCCRKSRSFLTQSFSSDYCDEGSEPCEGTPLDSDSLRELSQWYPDLEQPEDKCDFSPYIGRELEKLHGGSAFTYIKPLLCQVLGTTRPSINCVNLGDKCACCCFGFKYEDGQCGRQPAENDPLCSGY